MAANERSTQQLNNSVCKGAGVVLTADVAGAAPGRERLADRGFNRIRSKVFAQTMAQQHRRAQDRANRIGFPLAGYIRRRTMYRLLKSARAVTE